MHVLSDVPFPSKYLHIKHREALFKILSGFRGVFPLASREKVSH